jgi:hypothetical protein
MLLTSHKALVAHVPGGDHGSAAIDVQSGLPEFLSHCSAPPSEPANAILRPGASVWLQISSCPWGVR